MWGEWIFFFFFVIEKRENQIFGPQLYKLNLNIQKRETQIKYHSYLLSYSQFEPSLSI
jgi:hypothetical protein